MSLVDNEQRKLTASYFNTIAAAVTVTGVVAPLIAITYGLPGPHVGALAIIASVVWLFVSGCLHWFAPRLPKGLKP